MQAALTKLRLTRWDAAREKMIASPAAMVLLSVAGACLTGLLAQARVPLPGTPVPATGQVLAVLLCGAFLGAGYGALSQIIYVGIGAAGVPWFNGMAGGMSVLTGVTAGYLFAFPLIALMVGIYVRYARVRATAGVFAVMVVAVGMNLLLGSLYMKALLGLSLAQALTAGMVPFIAPEIAKAAIATAIVQRLRR